jgi:hypothetical protein
MEDFPSNSQRAKRAVREEPKPPAESKKIEKVVEGEVVRRKKPLGRRVRETFLGGDGPTVWEYALETVVIPAMRDMFVDATIGSVERMVYGEARSAHRRPGGRGIPGGGPVNYNGMARQVAGGRVSVREDPRPALSRRARASHDFEEIILGSRTEAETVLEGMFSFLEQYDQVSVSELYELLGISSQFTDQRWGWTDLRGSRVERIRNGYLLNLPQTELLER